MTKTQLRVLFIEDNEDDVARVARALAHGGYDVATERVASADALRAALQHRWDIVLSDYSLPHFNALDALAIAQQHDPGLPFIIVSGTIGEERAAEAMRRGARDYVMKENLARLGAVVERELRESGERRKRKQALLASEARLNEAQRLARLGSWELDIAKNDLKWSDEIYRIFELEPAQFAASYAAFLDMVHPDDRERVNRAYTESVRNRIPYDIVHRLRMRDGRVKYVHERCETFYDGEGRPLRSLGTVQDITEHKQAEDALFREKERAQTTLQSIGDAVATTDAHGLVTYLNPVAERLTGWGNDEAQGQPLLRVFNAVNEDTREPRECPALQALRERRIIELSARTLLIRRDGVEFAVEDTAAPIFSRVGDIIGAVLVFRDVSHSRMLTNQITYHARHDALTGLLNRREFELRLNQALESARNEGKHHAVCYLDLDQFKVVNDTCGHVAGDELLKQVSARLHKHIRDNDVLARFGGDEFTVLLEGCHPDKAYDIAETLRCAVNESRFAWGDKSFETSASIGLVPIDADSGSAGDILSAADSACYVAKDRGRNRVHVYRRNDSALAARRSEMQWVGRLQQALEQDSFRLYHQTMLPLNAHAGQGPHYEILLRKQDAEGNLILPNAFIPAAERYNLMPAIDRWVIRHTLKALSAQDQKAPYTCAINLSGQSLCDDRFLDFVIDEVSQAGVAPAHICFEITETAAIANLSRAMRFISTLKGMGCRFALDDFGSGLSSFAYLKNLPVDYLKIDGGFVRGMTQDAVDYAMVESINQIGHVMRIQTIAESVESEDILAALKQLGVDYAQGYALVSKD
ncbi:MAG: EAL domain-containing protein, partial [Gammaproteobacteria bacterium]|nr:EAL domain-containing protein [Gammaproteobacteria bacterium]